MRVFLGGLALSICAVMASEESSALDLKPSEIRGETAKKPVSVLQQRYFQKAWRPELGVISGSVLDEAYTDTVAYGVRGSMFVNEWFGFEAQYLKTNVKDSKDREALNQLRYSDLETNETVSPDPEVNPIRGIRDFNLIAAPFYGKLNLVDRMIIYSDFYFTGGVSQVETDQGELLATMVGVGQRFYLFKSLSLRIDFRDRIYTEQRAGQDSRKHSFAVDFGASYFFL